MEYQPTIGLEVHVELKTKTKMFCGCLNPSAGASTELSRKSSGLTLSGVERVNDSEEKHPNTNICPICLGHPGTLPTINKKAVESVLKLGLALDGKIPEISKFDRKNYFYPDLPKGYQISQYDKPLVLGGELNGVRITRIHLEEDTGRLLHPTETINQKLTTKNYSLVDFNRAGVPLMELVTEPDIKSGEQAVSFAKELQLILRYLEISDADMEKGQMRVEVNISLARTDTDKTQTNTESSPRQSVSSPHKSVILGTKVEIKNLNSFRTVQEAIEYEIKRQSELLKKGHEIHQETRGWDDVNKKTVLQRFKEESHDYRYFPEPDLPPMDLTKFNLEELKIAVPELPEAKRKRFINEYGLSAGQVEILVSDRHLAQYFEESASELKSQISNAKSNTLFNYLVTDVVGTTRAIQAPIDELKFKIKPEAFAHLIEMVEKGELTSRMAKDILLEMFKTGLDPHEIIKEKGISQISDEDTIEKSIQEVIAENRLAVADYKKGKGNALQFLIGKTMAKLKGQGNPGIISKLLNKELTKSE